MEKKVYELEEGEELILIESINLNGKEYLLLCPKNDNDEVQIGYEEDDNLILIDNDDSIYDEIVTKLYNKIKIEEDQ